MTMMSQAAAQAAIPTATGGLIRRAAIWAHAFVTYWDRRAAIKMLRGLDDRALRDIGISRSQIETAVGGLADPDIGRF